MFNQSLKKVAHEIVKVDFLCEACFCVSVFYAGVLRCSLKLVMFLDLHHRMTDARINFITGRSGIILFLAIDHAVFVLYEVFVTSYSYQNWTHVRKYPKHVNI